MRGENADRAPAGVELSERCLAASLLISVISEYQDISDQLRDFSGLT